MRDNIYCNDMNFTKVKGILLPLLMSSSILSKIANILISTYLYIQYSEITIQKYTEFVHIILSGKYYHNNCL